MEASTSEKESPAVKDKTVCVALAHPLRVRILEVANTRPISPIQFIREQLAPPGITFSTEKRALGTVAYHFKQLAREGCIKVIEEHPRRGGTEHVYRGTAIVFFTTEEFDKLPVEQREMLSRTSIQGFVARADTSMRTGRMDARTDRFVSWAPLELDKQGWKFITDLMDWVLPQVQKAQADSKERLADSGEAPIHATQAMFCFESPPPPTVIA